MNVYVNTPDVVLWSMVPSMECFQYLGYEYII